ncbi:MAG: peptidoglycan editing factor PgeF [Gammaproteobacteria bacterium]|nr:peptidoglycan editing factor PgeF [Gammaproteobacteria bacterium]
MDTLDTENFIKPDWPAPDNVVAFTTIRKGGVSEAPYDSLNLATHVGDDIDAVNENRKRLRQTFKLPQHIQWLTQVHGERAIEIDKETENFEADACFTQAYQTVCAVLTADCLPILLCNDSGSEVAAIHAGWKSLMAGVVETTIKSLNSPGSRLYAWLGPAIGPEAFEINDEIRLDFIQKNEDNGSAFEQRDGAWFADIQQLGRIALKSQNVSQIFTSDHCTVQEEALFYSYRRDGENTGRMASFIYLK